MLTPVGVQFVVLRTAPEIGVSSHAQCTEVGKQKIRVKASPYVACAKNFVAQRSLMAALTCRRSPLLLALTLSEC